MPKTLLSLRTREPQQAPHTRRKPSACQEKDLFDAHFRQVVDNTKVWRTSLEGVYY